MKILKRGVILAVFILFSLLVSAGININLIKTDYGPGELIEGSFNYSFAQDLPSNTPVVIDIGGEVVYENTLIDLLSLSSSPEIIPPTFSRSGADVSSVVYDFSTAGEQTIAAINLSEVTNIISINFNITGLKKGTDYPNLPRMAIGEPENVIWTYRGPLINNEFSPMSRTYLNSLINNFESSIRGNSEDIYCEKINIKSSSKYRITARVKQLLNGATLIASISTNEYPDTHCNPLAYTPSDDTQCCVLSTISSSYSDKSCQVNRDVTADGIAYLCLYANTGESTKEYFMVASESDPSTDSGFYNGDSVKYDFFMWGEYNKFLTNLSKEVNLSGFEERFSDYLELVPITIKTNGPGKVMLDKLDLWAEWEGTPPAHLRKFTPIAYEAEKVKADFLTQRFESLELFTPLEYGDEKTLTITIGSDTKNINFNVKEIPEAIISFTPVKIKANQPVSFTASNSFTPALDKTLVSYDWTFGDGANGTGVDVAHTYSNTREYNVTLLVKDSGGLEGFTIIPITVRSLSESLDYTINTTAKFIANTRKSFDESADYVKDTVSILQLNKLLDDAETKLVLINDQYKGALGYNGSVKETKLNEAQNSLITLLDAVPSDVKVDRFQYPANIINLDDIPSSSLLGLNKSVDEESFKEGLLNYQTDITINGEARLVHIRYLSGKEDNFILVKKQITSSKSLSGKVYEYIKENAEVKDLLTEGYEAVSSNSLYRWPIGNDIYYTLNSSDIGIATDLKTFVLPPLKDLEITGGVEEGFNCGNNVCNYAEDEASCPEDCKAKYPIGFIIFLIVLAIAGVYYINFYHGPFNFKAIGQDLKKLFKKKLSLFKDKKDLVNLITYIRKSVSRGLTAQQIKYVLKQKGWTDPQIEEAFKQAKVKGK